MLIHMQVYNKRTPGILSYERMFILFYVCKTTNKHTCMSRIHRLNEQEINNK